MSHSHLNFHSYHLVATGKKTTQFHQGFTWAKGKFEGPPSSWIQLLLPNPKRICHNIFILGNIAKGIKLLKVLSIKLDAEQSYPHSFHSIVESIFTLDRLSSNWFQSEYWSLGNWTAHFSRSTRMQEWFGGQGYIFHLEIPTFVSLLPFNGKVWTYSQREWEKPRSPVLDNSKEYFLPWETTELLMNNGRGKQINRILYIVLLAASSKKLRMSGIEVFMPTYLNNNATQSSSKRQKKFLIE